jgi:oxaloacetate decarboxylase alpha subunit
VVELRKLGMETVMNLIYSIPPRHTDAYHAQKARDAAALTTSVKLRNRIA